MASHHHDIDPPGTLEIPKGFYITAAVLIAIGVIAFAAGLMNDPGRAWRGYVIGFWFTFSVALSGPFFIATQYLTKASWAVSIRRIPEAFGVFLYPCIILGLIALMGIDHLFGWLDPTLFDPGSDNFDPVVAEKEGFLTRTNIWIATIASTVILAGVHFLLRRNSLRQDEEGGYALTKQNMWLSAGFIILFVIGVSFMTWYWLMSYNPHWYSTMLSVYAFAGLFQTGLALMALILVYLLRRGTLGDTLGIKHIHDTGQLVFGFTVFFAYIGFSQFLLIWYSNIPEAAEWYVHRTTEGWGIFLLILPFVKFILPFLLLLPQDHKKNKRNILVFVCIGLILTHFYDIWLMVMPYWFNLGGQFTPVFPLIEIAITLGFVGLFMGVVARSFASTNLVPMKDPYLAESIPHSHDHLIYPNGKPGESDEK